MIMLYNPVRFAYGAVQLVACVPIECGKLVAFTQAEF